MCEYLFSQAAVCKISGSILLILSKLCLTWANTGTIEQMILMMDQELTLKGEYR